MERLHKRLVVIAIVKNNARTLKRAILKLEKLCGFFDQVAFVVYENNSTDESKTIIQTLSRKISAFTYACEDLSAQDMSAIATVVHKDGKPCRIEIIARARELARTLALRDYGDYDLVLNFDTDAAWFSLGDITRNAARLASGEFDCVCANGITKWLKYRDAFAFRSPEHPYGPELLGEYWWEVTRARIQRRLIGRRLVPVYSAFGGAALYSIEAYKAGRYSAIPDSRYMEVQKSLDMTKSLLDERSRASAIPIANTNYSQSIVCEHVPFHYAMRGRNFGRIAIDPAWRVLFLD
jgi:glycosyltransferase involved in cell wall biosynthesis